MAALGIHGVAVNGLVSMGKRRFKNFFSVSSVYMSRSLVSYVSIDVRIAGKMRSFHTSHQEFTILTEHGRGNDRTVTADKQPLFKSDKTKHDAGRQLQ